MPLKTSITPQDAVDLLNSMVAADQLATHVLVEDRQPCNELLAQHPTVQVSGTKRTENDDIKYEVGLLGVINGLFGVDDTGYGAIEANFDAGGNLVGFQVRE